MFRRHRWQPIGAIASACARCRTVRTIRPSARRGQVWVREYVTAESRYLGVLKRAPSCPPRPGTPTVPVPVMTPAPPPPTGPLADTIPMRLPPPQAHLRAPMQVGCSEWVHGVHHGGDDEIWPAAVILREPPVYTGRDYRLYPARVRAPHPLDPAPIVIPPAAWLWADLPDRRHP